MFWNNIREGYVYFIEQYKKDGGRLPNRITELRLLFSLVVGLLLIFNKSVFVQWMVFVLFVLVVATDKLDGYLARRLDQVTDLGKLIDPCVDKVLMFVVLVVLSFKESPLLQILIIVTIVCELVVALVSIVAKGIPVNWIGKSRMVIQCCAASFLLLPVDDLDSFRVGAMVLTVIVNLFSVVSHIWEATKKMREK